MNSLASNDGLHSDRLPNHRPLLHQGHVLLPRACQEDRYAKPLFFPQKPLTDVLIRHLGRHLPRRTLHGALLRQLRQRRHRRLARHLLARLRGLLPDFDLDCSFRR